MTGVVAMNRAGCVGSRGTIPWRHPQDLAFFKRLTMGGTLVMGRRTWDSLPRKPLPGRDHVVLTRRATVQRAERVVFTRLVGLEEVLDSAVRPVFVIGGAQIWDALWDRIDDWYVTRVPDDVADCDTFFPRTFEPGFRIENSERLSDVLTVDHLVRAAR